MGLSGPLILILNFALFFDIFYDPILIYIYSCISFFAILFPYPEELVCKVPKLVKYIQHFSDIQGLLSSVIFSHSSDYNYC